jgi:hypothetical protein
MDVGERLPGGVFFEDVAERSQHSLASWSTSIQSCGGGKRSRNMRLMGVLSGQALAADLPVRPPLRAPVPFIPPPPVFPWSGTSTSVATAATLSARAPLLLAELVELDFLPTELSRAAPSAATTRWARSCSAWRAISIGTTSRVIHRPASAAKFQALGSLVIISSIQISKVSRFSHAANSTNRTSKAPLGYSTAILRRDFAKDDPRA